MCQQLINRSPDLKTLRDEGYEIEIRGPYLFIYNIPYVNSRKEVCNGIIITDLSLANNKTIKPSKHIVHFIGEHPCDKNGHPIEGIRHSEGKQKIVEGVEADRSFSNKPKDGYSDYYHKMTNYINIICHPAQAIDGTVSPKTFKVIASQDEDSVHNYVDTNASRSNIHHLNEKFASLRIGIIGLGGTGSYVLDLIAKTQVNEIHLFDGDSYYQHNAFRSPGAPSAEQLDESPMKSNYFKQLYSKMHKKIYSHEFYIDSSTIDSLPNMDYVFLCIDDGEAKKEIINKMERDGSAFIDVGIGVHLIDDSLIGMLRVTTSTKKNRDHIRSKKRISFGNGAPDEYVTNIQIAELNMLNAAMAVIKWKKLCGFYQDLESEHHCVYTINTNQLTSEDQSS